MDRPNVGDILISNDGPIHTSSGVKVITTLENGVRLRRIHLSYNNEEFFLSFDALNNSHWIQVPDNTQLMFI